MSRRVGPGGRLRPAPRPHRNFAHLEPGRATPFSDSPQPDGAIGGTASAVAGGPGAVEYADTAAAAGGAVAPAELAPAESAVAEPFGSAVHPFVAPDRYATVRASYAEDDSDRPSGGRSLAVAPMAGAMAAVAEPRPEERREERRERPERPVTMPPARPVERRASADRPAGPTPSADEQPRPAPAGSERTTPTCTAPQLRRFIKSRAYVPMHELRRRFGIEGGDDDVSPVDLESGRVFVGLPALEGQLLGDLLRAGEVGFELSMDPQTPVVVGVYSMRPVPRP